MSQQTSATFTLAMLVLGGAVGALGMRTLDGQRIRAAEESARKAQEQLARALSLAESQAKAAHSRAHAPSGERWPEAGSPAAPAVTVPEPSAVAAPERPPIDFAVEEESPSVEEIAAAMSERARRPERTDFRVGEVEYRVTERTADFWRLSWQVEVHNDGDRDAPFAADVKWMNRDGYVLERQRTPPVVIPALEARVLSDSTVITMPAAATVYEADIEVSRSAPH